MVERVRLKGMQDVRLVARGVGTRTENGSNHRSFPEIVRSTVGHKVALSSRSYGELTAEQHEEGLTTDRDEVRKFYTKPNGFHDMPTTFEEITNNRLELELLKRKQDAEDAKLMQEGVAVNLAPVNFGWRVGKRRDYPVA